MDSGLNIKKLKAIGLGIMSILLVGCQDTIPNRALIDSAAQTTGGTTGGGSGIVTPVRPDNAIKFKPNFCGCKDGKAITYGNCGSFCAGKNTAGAGILYAEFNLNEEITLNTKLVNLNGWCNTSITETNTNPKCVLRATDDEITQTNLEVEMGTSTNSLKINIDKLLEDRAYVLTLVESSSGAKSDSIQIIKYSTDIPLTTLGPIKNSPITQYTCLWRPPSVDTNNGDIYNDAAFRMHFYFIPRMPPSPIPSGNDYICHDYLNPLYGAIDDVLFPRLEAISGIFNLWDTTDPRFYDNNGNKYDDINDIIIQKAKNFGATNIPPTTRYFEPFYELVSLDETVAQSSSTSGSTSGSSSSGAAATKKSLGYFMAPWIDQTTFRAYCLNSSHYNSSNPLFKAMRDIIGVDTEGIYVGVKAPETVIDRDGVALQAPNDYIFIRETDLKKVWFYMKAGVPTVPTDSNVASVPVYFYYPLNIASPFVRTSTQKIYQVKGATELAGQTLTATAGNYPPHDRRVGCIPKF
jgi:hypothetical protein